MDVLITAQTPDSVGDIMDVASVKIPKRNIPVLHEHMKDGYPIGHIPYSSIRKKNMENGVMALTGRMKLADSIDAYAKPKIIKGLIQHGSLTGGSAGYRIGKDVKYLMTGDNKRIVKNAELIEYSITATPTLKISGVL